MMCESLMKRSVSGMGSGVPNFNGRLGRSPGSLLLSLGISSGISNFPTKAPNARVLRIQKIRKYSQYIVL